MKVKIDDRITDPHQPYTVDIEVVDGLGSHWFYGEEFVLSRQNRILKHYTDRKPPGLSAKIILCDR